MSQNCRAMLLRSRPKGAIALAEYPIELQAQRYIKLYHQVLNRQTKGAQKASA
jgi:hypothetical protein